MSDKLLDVCKAAYAATANFHERLKPHLGTSDFGYKILYSPPKAGVGRLFLGFQPGGGAEDANVGAASGERREWPTMHEYGQAYYKLAERVRALWSLEAIEDSVALNRIFFRAPGKKEWKINLPKYWREVTEDFCGVLVKQIVEIVRPQKIVALGLTCVNEFKRRRDRVSHNGRVLVRSGELWGDYRRCNNPSKQREYARIRGRDKGDTKIFRF